MADNQGAKEIDEADWVKYCLKMKGKIREYTMTGLEHVGMPAR